MEYEAAIILEVHLKLLTKTKMFCGCTTEAEAKVNSHICPVCMGLPGALPQFNKKVIEYAIKAGLVLKSDITKVFRMDRKNIYYPDNPKNYQITQYEFPICRNGFIEIENADKQQKKIKIEKIYIEEDTARFIHASEGTLIDFNRAGIPFIVIVSRPDIRNGEEAVIYLQKLKETLTLISILDCKMKDRDFYCDLKVSVKDTGTGKCDNIVEIKNLSSIKSVEKAINYEFNRQVEAMKNKDIIVHEERRWDEINKITLPMRSKEDANDYRYFPEGDLATFNISDECIQNIKSTIKELI